MKQIFKIFLFSLLISSSAVFLSACSEKEIATDTGKEKNEAEINEKYEDIINTESGEELLPEDYNPILNNFTTADFQFTLEDDTLAFNLAENSYTKITPKGATFAFHDATLTGDYFEGRFKNAKGISIASTPSELIASYKLGEENFFTDENAVITFAFATDGSYEFSTLSLSDAKRLLEIYNDAVSSSKNPIEMVFGEFGAYSTMALVQITPTSEGTVGEYAMYRFDKTAQE